MKFDVIVSYRERRGTDVIQRRLYHDVEGSCPRVAMSRAMRSCERTQVKPSLILGARLASATEL